MSDRGDPAALAAGADGDSVTAERLTDPVVDAFEAGEQPHHLLQGQSLDVAAGGDEDRVFPGVEAVVSLVATDRRVLVVVPRPIERRTNAIDYADIQRVEADTGRFKRFALETEGGSLGVNLPDEETPEPTAAFVRDRVESAGDPGGRSGRTTRSANAGRDDSPTGDSRRRETGDRGGSADRAGAGDDATGGADAGPTDGGSATDATGHGPDDPGADPDPDETGDSGDAGDDGADPLDQLERLADLRDRGIVTDEEFEERKQELLDRL